MPVNGATPWKDGEMREARAETGLERNFRGILSRVCIFGIRLPKGPFTLDRSFGKPDKMDESEKKKHLFVIVYIRYPILTLKLRCLNN